MSNHLRYLTRQMESAHSARIADICLVAGLDESAYRAPKAFEAFRELDYPEICKLLQIPLTSSVTKHIDSLRTDEEWASFLYSYKKYGLLAVIEMPEHSHFRIDEQGEFAGCRVRSGVITQEIVYAESIPELVDVAVRVGENHFYNQFDAWKAEQV